MNYQGDWEVECVTISLVDLGIDPEINQNGPTSQVQTLAAQLEQTSLGDNQEAQTVAIAANHASTSMAGQTVDTSAMTVDFSAYGEYRVWSDEDLELFRLSGGPEHLLDHEPDLNLIERYDWMSYCQGKQLANDQLPEDPIQLEALCQWMSEKLERRYNEIGAQPVLPPINHQYYPYWYPYTPINHQIDRVVLEIQRQEPARGGAEALDDEMML